LTSRTSHYLPEQDAYRCPAGETMKWWFNRVDEHGKTLRHYWTTNSAFQNRP
jgi:hypothetical protein